MFNELLINIDVSSTLGTALHNKHIQNRSCNKSIDITGEIKYKKHMAGIWVHKEVLTSKICKSSIRNLSGIQIKWF